MRHGWVLAAALASCPAAAQETVQVEASLLSDYRQRGLSSSAGQAAARVRVDAPLGAGFDASLVAATARGASRHGSADAAIDARLGYGRDTGLLRWHAGVVGHAFPGGRGAQDYVEIEAGTGVAVGPVDLSLLVSYAPSQRAIGGDNVYRRARLSSALPGTPVTISGHFGRSTGNRRDTVQADRLRPGGAYSDWSLGADYAIRRVTLSLAYTDTDIGARSAARHRGAALVAGAHVSF